MKPEIKYTQVFINNEYVDSVSGKTFKDINPVDETVITEVQEGDVSDIDKAVAAAAAAFKFGSKWRTMDPCERGRLLYRVADYVERDIDYLANLEAMDVGKTVGNAKGDMKFVVDVLRYYAGWADKINGKTIPTQGNFISMTRHEPVGVVGAILPWNYPLSLFSWKLGPAVATGCTLVVKPAEQTPLTTLYFGSLLVEAGFPPGVVNIVPGYGPTAGAALSNHPRVDKVAFTGSTDVGRLIMQASGVSNLKRVSLELGGKSPLVVFDDVDVAEAAAQAQNAAMDNHGQCCVAATRTFVHAGIYDRFVAETKTLAEARVVGDPFAPTTTQGPQIDNEQFTKVLELIESGKSEGARLVTGGSRIGAKGYFVQPTVFADVKDDMRIAKEEIFGPVQSILPFTTWEELDERINNTTYGLGAGVLTNDINKAMMFAQIARAGTVWVNCYLSAFPSVPFGGFKQSGIGRELGEYALEHYTEVKTITIKVPQKNS